MVSHPDHRRKWVYSAKYEGPNLTGLLVQSQCWMEIFSINWQVDSTDNARLPTQLMQEEIARGVRRSNKPFGGIQVSETLAGHLTSPLIHVQLVLCGDFCQLPPIGDKAKFAFDALSWKRCIQRMITLKKVFRQKDQGIPPDLDSAANELIAASQSLSTSSTRCESAKCLQKQSLSFAPSTSPWISRMGSNPQSCTWDRRSY